MENNSIEMALMEPEERELVEFIYRSIPVEDRGDLTPDDILLVLDLMDDYLEEQVKWSIWTAKWMRRSS